jgi:hypothetical protein
MVDEDPGPADRPGAPIEHRDRNLSAAAFRAEGRLPTAQQDAAAAHCPRTRGA